MRWRRVLPPLLALTAAAAVAGGPARAGVVNQVVIPFEAVRSNTCAGEAVLLSGAVHLLAVEQPTGGFVGHANFQGVEGTGLESGATYRAVSVDLLRLDLGPPPSSVTAVGTIRLVGPGPGDDEFVRVVLHTATNAAGEVTAAVEQASEGCA
jgi:hypothetical protein